MNERNYKVYIDGQVVAREMDLRTATILVRALFQEYYEDHMMKISVQEEDRAVGCE